MVNFTNILKAAFPPIFLRRKGVKPYFKYKKAVPKMLVKLTPDVTLVLVQNYFCSFKGKIPMSHQKMTTSGSNFGRLKRLIRRSTPGVSHTWPAVRMWPADISRSDKSLNFDQILLIFIKFVLFLGLFL